MLWYMMIFYEHKYLYALNQPLLAKYEDCILRFQLEEQLYVPGTWITKYKAPLLDIPLVHWQSMKIAVHVNHSREMRHSNPGLVISHNPSLAGKNCVTKDYGFLILLLDDVIIISFGISFPGSGLRRAIPTSSGNTEKKDPPRQALAPLVGSFFSVLSLSSGIALYIFHDYIGRVWTSYSFPK